MNKFFDKKYFQKFAQGKGYSSQENTPKFAKRLAELRMLGKTKGNLLDIGCAFGFFLDKAKKWGFQTYGIDISSYVIKKSQKNHQVKILDVSKKKLPFKKNFFEVVILDHVLEHLSNPTFTLKEIKRVLRPGGIVFIEVPLRKRWATEKSHLSYFDRLSLEFILKNMGFKILKIGEEGGRLRNLFGLVRLIFKGNTLFNFITPGMGEFLICYAQKK